MPETEYKPCHCGANCLYFNDDEFGPCWGEVAPYGISGDDDFGHYCEGHYGMPEGAGYKEKPK